MLLEKLDIHMGACVEGLGQLNLCLILYTKNNLRWIIDLNGKNKPIKLQEENVGAYLHYLGNREDFLVTESKNHRRKMDKLDS